LNRLEPNLLLAVTTGFALVLLTLTVSVYGAGEPVRNLVLVVICASGFILLNPILQRMMKVAPRPPMIHPDAPGTAAWAALFPMMIIASAAVPVFWPGRDYGLLVIIASIWFGLTAESAMKARRQDG
jgi:hypothetical protein